MKPHKHAELIKAWADGAEIQIKLKDDALDTWQDSYDPDWSNSFIEYRSKPECNGFCGEYECKENKDKCLRIKPELKPDYHSYLALISREHDIWRQFGYIADESRFDQIIKIIHDGETDKPKSAEVLK